MNQFNHLKAVVVDDNELNALLRQELNTGIPSQFKQLGSKVAMPTVPVTGTIMSRIQSIGAFFNDSLTTTDWNNVCDAHPAAEAVVEEIQKAYSEGKLGTVMNRIDNGGYLTLFNKSTGLFSIVFTAHNEAMSDTQKDMVNQERLDWVNRKDEALNPNGGWVEPTFKVARQLTWTFQIN